jgi:phage terminase large subunit-like protein
VNDVSVLRQFAELTTAIDRRKQTHRLDYYDPYPYQVAFHNALGYGTTKSAVQRALMAANQVGKTTCAAMEVAIHATGKYPSWWTGNRITRANVGLVGGLTNESVRDICQKELFGEPTDDRLLGYGTVPIDCIGKYTRKAGVPNAFDSVMIKHVTGAWSRIFFRAYEQGPKKHMGSRIDWGWPDEEAPEEIWSQYLRATLATRGFLFMTFTPEEGITKVVHGFINNIKAGQALIRATWDDAPHMNHERREQMLLAIPEHQREMRSKGIPLMGSGLVYPVKEEEIKCDPFEIPQHWPRISAIDFGVGHPFAAAWVAWDRDRDVVYLYDCYSKQDQLISENISQLNRRGKWIPVIWPHDGLNREPKSGKPYADLYRDEGANMWHEKFSNPSGPGEEEGRGGNSVEFGIAEILTRMQTGRFKVFKTLEPWFEEFRMFHRDDGKIVKQYDDLMDATRYACLSMRHATTPTLKIKMASPPRGATNW